MSTIRQPPPLPDDVDDITNDAGTDINTPTSPTAPFSVNPSSTILPTPVPLNAKVGGDDWTIAEQLRSDQQALQARGIKPTRDLSLIWDHLSVRGVGGADDVVFATDLGSIFMPWTLWTQKRKAAGFTEALNDKAGHDQSDAMHWIKGMGTPKKGEPGLRKGQRYLFKDFSGLLKPGEMMLVVGRPGSGCTTFLKALAGLTRSYAGFDGDVYYGALKAHSKEMRPLKSDVSFISEEEHHDPNLLVGRTMDFALRTQTPSNKARPLGDDGVPISQHEWQKMRKYTLLRAFGIEDTVRTKVGDQYVRGVSGGERKRVSLAEVLTSDAQIQCWDNPTRGLDASSALSFAKICRTLSDVSNHVNVVTAYQAGNGIYRQFDKVCVMAEGRLLYYGPRAEARPYFEELGFEHMDGANTADYFTAVTALNERKIRPGFEGRVPTTAAEFAAIYRKSDVARRMRAEVDEYLADKAGREAETEAAREAAALQKSRWAFEAFAQKTSFAAQVRAAVIKNAQQRWGDQWTLWMRQGCTFVMAFVFGSLFYQLPLTTLGVFFRGGVLFLLIFYPVVLSFADLLGAFVGRQVLAKHKAYSMYRPSAVLLAQTIVDVPLFLVQIFLYVVIIYWLAGLRSSAGLFFIAYLFSWLVSMAIVGGSIFIVFALYSGFPIYTPSMHPWFSWIRWLNPLYYALEALVSGELEGLMLQCVPPQLAPYGPGYVGQPAGCAFIGSQMDSTLVSGAAFVHEGLEFFTQHRWRNFGIIIALWVGAMALGMYFLERLPAAGSTEDVTLYKRGGGGAFVAAASKRGTGPRDEEDGGIEQQITEKPHTPNTTDNQPAITSHGTTFTWKDLCYTVKADGKDKQLLDNVSGYCKAGTITALMGSSGAGKTTLMDVLAARKDFGVISGEVSLNGRPLPLSFQRTTGYCEQLDVHLPQATVREALEFSALLRQPRHLSDKEKLAYVDTIVDLLELHDIEDAIIGTPGEGLGVEQRKRLTIGVELVSKPSLLFLDEPTSGLDGQSSFIIVTFLRKLAAAGQSILCTIHQPSAALFAGFDQLLLLKAGGRTVYFGPVAEVPGYFKGHGVEWPHDVNPAEYMIDIVSDPHEREWAQVWLQSEEHDKMMADIEEVKRESAAATTSDSEQDNYEYAATLWTQIRVVNKRSTIQLYRDVEYVLNKAVLHIAVALIVGFSFWRIGHSYADLQNRMFSIMLLIFVAPGVIVQAQHHFIANRDIFETREKKGKFYSWVAFCVAEIVAEWPYLLICAFLWFVCWYPASIYDMSASAAGPVFLAIVLYEFLYTGMGQFIAAYAPNPEGAALVLPLFFGALVSFCGILVPYQAITAFWRYWLYYLNPFTWVMHMLVFPMRNVTVKCAPHEYGLFDPPAGLTCGEYLEGFMTYATGYVNNPNATALCEYCGYKKGSEFLATMRMGRYIDGWKGILITLLFVISSYSLVFLLLKLRSKKTKTAKS